MGKDHNTNLFISDIMCSDCARLCVHTNMNTNKHVCNHKITTVQNKSNST